MREDFADIMYVMLDAAPHDAEVAASLEVAMKRYRASFLTVARRVEELRAIRADLVIAMAAEVL